MRKWLNTERTYLPSCCNTSGARSEPLGRSRDLTLHACSERGGVASPAPWHPRATSHRPTCASICLRGPKGEGGELPRSTTHRRGGAAGPKSHSDPPSGSRCRSTSYVRSIAPAVRALRSAKRPNRRALEPRDERPPSFVDHLVGTEQDRLGHGKAERPGGLEVHGHLVFCRKLHWKIARLRAA
jgi:hypothetical protein